MRSLPKSWLVVLAALVLVSLVAAPAVVGDLTRPLPGGEIRGTIVSVDASGTEFVLNPNDGRNLTFQMDEDAPVYINDEIAQLQELKPDDEATVIYRRDGNFWLAVEVRCIRLSGR